MIVESENMKKLREKNLLAEIRAKTIVIQDAPPRTPDTKEIRRQLEHDCKRVQKKISQILFY